MDKEFNLQEILFYVSLCLPETPKIKVKPLVVIFSQQLSMNLHFIFYFNKRMSRCFKVSQSSIKCFDQITEPTNKKNYENKTHDQDVIVH